MDKDSTIIIKKFDENFKLEFSAKVKKSKAKRIYLGTELIDGKLIYMYYTIDKKKKTYNGFRSEFTDNGELTNIEELITLNYEKRNNINELFYKISKDKSKFLFVAEYNKKFDEGNYSASISVFDNSFNKKYDTNIQLDEDKSQVKTSSWG